MDELGLKASLREALENITQAKYMSAEVARDVTSPEPAKGESCLPSAPPVSLADLVRAVLWASREARSEAATVHGAVIGGAGQCDADPVGVLMGEKSPGRVYAAPARR